MSKKPVQTTLDSFLGFGAKRQKLGSEAAAAAAVVEEESEEIAVAEGSSSVLSENELSSSDEEDIDEFETAEERGQMDQQENEGDTLREPMRDLAQKQYPKDIHKRSFQSDWFKKYEWLEYDLALDKAFCYPCRMAAHHGWISSKVSTGRGRPQGSFTSHGFNTWTTAKRGFEKHECSSFHRESSVIVHRHRTGKTLVEVLEETNESTQQKSRKCLVTIFKTIRYLLGQGLASRGRTEKESNFNRLLDLLSQSDPLLLNWMSKTFNNECYTSHSITNEIALLMCTHIQRNIITEINDSGDGYFGILVDESKAIDGVEELSLTVRWVDKDSLAIHEDFLGFHALDKLDSESIYECIKRLLIRLNLDLNNCRGQTYDGASKFQGHINGVRVRFNSQYPLAIHVWCMMHNIGLAIKEAVLDLIPSISDSMGVMKDVINHIRSSAVREQDLKNILKEAGEQSSRLRPLCPTRMTLRAKALERVLKNWNLIICVLSAQKDTASRGYAHRMQQFDIYFSTHLLCLILDLGDRLSASVQTKNMSVSMAIMQAKLTVDLFREKGCDESFKQFWDMVTKNQPEEVLDPVIPRKHNKPVRYRTSSSRSATETFETVESLYKNIFISAMTETADVLDNRFSQQGLTAIGKMESLLIDASHFDTKLMSLPESSLDIVELVQTHFGEDFEIENFKKELLSLTKAVVNVKCLSDIAQQITLDSRFGPMFPATRRFVQLLLTVAPTTASSERSFSTMKRLKTYIRNKMSQERLTVTSILHTHKERLYDMNLEIVGQDFIDKNDRRLNVFGRF